MSHLDGSLVLPGLTHRAVLIWRVNRAGKPKMAILKYFIVGAIGCDTSFTLHVAPDPHPQAELASSHGILRAGVQETKGGSCKASWGLGW